MAKVTAVTSSPMPFHPLSRRLFSSYISVVTFPTKEYNTNTFSALTHVQVSEGTRQETWGVTEKCHLIHLYIVIIIHSQNSYKK